MWILQALAQRQGLTWDYRDVGEMFDEMRSTMPSLAGMSWQRQRLEAEAAITYPFFDVQLIFI